MLTLDLKVIYFSPQLYKENIDFSVYIYLHIDLFTQKYHN